MPKYIQGNKLCPISQHIMFCSACMYKSAFGYNDGLAPSRGQATVVNNGDSFHWWTQLFGIYNYNWTHNIVHSRYLAVAFIGGSFHSSPIRARYGCSPWDQSVFRCHLAFNIRLQSTATHQEFIVIPSQFYPQSIIWNQCRFLPKGIVFYISIFQPSYLHHLCGIYSIPPAHPTPHPH